MKKEQLINEISLAGDAIVNYRSPQSKKFKYIVCTLDFDNYFISRKNKPSEQEGKVLVFCWDSNNFKQVDPELVSSTEPLNKILEGAKWKVKKSTQE